MEKILKSSATYPPIKSETKPPQPSYIADTSSSLSTQPETSSATTSTQPETSSATPSISPKNTSQPTSQKMVCECRPVKESQQMGGHQLSEYIMDNTAGKKNQKSITALTKLLKRNKIEDKDDANNLITTYHQVGGKYIPYDISFIDKDVGGINNIMKTLH